MGMIDRWSSKKALKHKLIKDANNMVLVFWVKILIQHGQYRDFHDCLMVISWLIFYNLDCNIVVRFRHQTFGNLSKCSLPQYIFHNVPLFRI